MTLIEVIRAMEAAASEQPAVNMIVESDVFRLNSCSDAKYGVFAFVEGQHSGDVNSDFVKYQFSLFYVDRLTAKGDNLLDIHSTGVMTIDNIIRRLADYGVAADTYTITPFSQRFLDECAGVYATVTFDALAAPCGEVFETRDIKII